MNAIVHPEFCLEAPPEPTQRLVPLLPLFINTLCQGRGSGGRWPAVGQCNGLPAQGYKRSQAGTEGQRPRSPSPTMTLGRRLACLFLACVLPALLLGGEFLSPTSRCSLCPGVLFPPLHGGPHQCGSLILTGEVPAGTRGPEETEVLSGEATTRSPELGFENRGGVGVAGRPLGSSPGLSVPWRGTVGRSLCLSVPQFPHLNNRGANGPDPVGSRWGIPWVPGGGSRGPVAGKG